MRRVETPISMACREGSAASDFHALAAGLKGLGRCGVTLTWHVATRGRHDEGIIVATIKAMRDGLVDVDVDVDVGAVVVVDDTPEYMDKLMPVIAYEGDCAPRLELQVVAIP